MNPFTLERAKLHIGRNDGIPTLIMCPYCGKDTHLSMYEYSEQVSIYNADNISISKDSTLFSWYNYSEPDETHIQEVRSSYLECRNIECPSQELSNRQTPNWMRDAVYETSQYWKDLKFAYKQDYSYSSNFGYTENFISQIRRLLKDTEFLS